MNQKETFAIYSVFVCDNTTKSNCNIYIVQIFMYFIIDANDVVWGASGVCIIKQTNLKVYSVIVNNLILMKPYNCWKLYKETRNHSLNVIYEVIFMVVAQLKSMVSFWMHIGIQIRFDFAHFLPRTLRCVHFSIVYKL